jgi:hypothetical protein
MFATTPDDVYQSIVQNKRDTHEFLVQVYADNADTEYDELPVVLDEDLLPTVFPCLLIVRWAGNAEVQVVATIDLNENANLTYHLCKMGAKLGDVIGSV